MHSERNRPATPGHAAFASFHAGNSRAIRTARSKLWTLISSTFTPSGTGFRERTSASRILAQILRATSNEARPTRDRDVPADDVPAGAGDRAEALVRGDDLRAGVRDAARTPADEDEVPQAVDLDRLPEPCPQLVLSAGVDDDLVHDRLDRGARVQASRELPGPEVPVEREAGVVLVEDLRDVQRVEVGDGRDGVLDLLHETLDRLLARP